MNESALWKKAETFARRVRTDPAVRSAFFAFALTRIFVMAAFVAGGSVSYSPDPDAQSDMRHADLRADKITVSRNLQRVMLTGDSGWYLGIARNGYERHPFEAHSQRNWAFFPVYPMLMYAAGVVTGKDLFGGALLSHIFFFAALILLYKFVVESGFDSDTANRSVLYLAIFPVSYFFSVPMTESLFLFLTLACFLAAAREQWLLAGLVGAVAAATRVNGVLLLPVLLIFYWQRQGGFRLQPRVLWLAVIPTGLISFMFFLWLITGNPLAFKDVLTAWGRSTGFFLQTYYDWVAHSRRLVEGWNLPLLGITASFLAFWAVWFWARRRDWAFAAYVFLSIFLPLSSLLLISTTRYMSVVFPIFIALALIGKSATADRIITFLFLTLFGVMTVAFSLKFSFAAA